MDAAERLKFIKQQQAVINAPVAPVVESPLMKAALDAVGRGWFVLALNERAKEPDTEFCPHGVNSSTNDVAVVREWFAKKPNANYGIDLGRSNLTVLDFDSGKPSDDLPATLLVSTGRGVHAYYSGAVKQGKMPLGDIKSTGGYVLGIGCVHPSGAVYSVVKDVPIAATPSLDALRGGNERVRDEAPRNERKLIPHGQIHLWMLTQAGKLRDMGLGQPEIEVALLKLVHDNCEPPIDDDKVIRMSYSICNFEEGVPNSGHALKLNQTAEQPETVKQSQPVEPVKPIVVVDGDAFLAEKIPPRKVLIRTITQWEPVFFEQSINQVFAWRGIGKTCLGLGFVRSLACAEPFLNFQCDERVHVLYIEGELPDGQMQERWKSIVGKTNGYAHLATIDKQPGHSYNSLATEAGMAQIEATLADFKSQGIDIKVLMLDNISTLFNVSANEEETWIIIQKWLTSLRSRGYTIVFFHHAGKAGLSRSHSKSEDMLDVSIKLEAPEEQESGHLHALMTFDKARAGLSERPAEIKLHRTHSMGCACLGTDGPFCPGDGVRWEFIPGKNKQTEAFALFAQGQSVTQVRDFLNVPLGTVKMWRTKYSQEVIKSKGAAK